MPDPYLQYFTNPYDDIENQSRLRLDEIVGQKDALRQQRSAYDTETSAQRYGDLFGSFLLPMLAGAASNDFTTGLGWGTGIAGQNLGRLEAQDEEKKKLLDTDIGLLDQESNYMRDSIYDAKRSKAGATSQFGMNYLTGNIVGTDPYEKEKQDQLDHALTVANANNHAYKPEPLFSSDAVNKIMGSEVFPPGTQISARDVSAGAALKGSANGTGSLNLRQANAANAQMSALIPGLVPVPGMQPADKTDKLRELYGLRFGAVSSLDEMENLMKQRAAEGKDPITLLGEDARLLQGFGKTVVPWARAYANTGASLTGQGPYGELEQLLSLSPDDFGSLTGSGPALLSRTLKGQDALKWVQDLRKIISQKSAEKALAYNMYDPSARDIYQPDTVKMIDDLAPRYGSTTPWGSFADVLAGSQQSNPVLQQQAGPAPVVPQVPGTSSDNIFAPAQVSPTPTPVGMPQGAAGKRTLTKAGVKREAWVDASGNPLAWVQ